MPPIKKYEGIIPPTPATLETTGMLAALAAIRGIPRTEIVRAAIDSYFADLSTVERLEVEAYLAELKEQATVDQTKP